MYAICKQTIQYKTIYYNLIPSEEPKLRLPMVGFLMLTISFWSGSQDADHSWFHPPLLCGDVCCPSKMWIFGNFDSCMNPSEIKNPLKSSKNLRFGDAGKKNNWTLQTRCFFSLHPPKKNIRVDDYIYGINIYIIIYIYHNMYINT